AVLISPAFTLTGFTVPSSFTVCLPSQASLVSPTRTSSLLTRALAAGLIVEPVSTTNTQWMAPLDARVTSILLNGLSLALRSRDPPQYQLNSRVIDGNTTGTLLLLCAILTSPLLPSSLTSSLPSQASLVSPTTWSANMGLIYICVIWGARLAA